MDHYSVGMAVSKKCKNIYVRRTLCEMERDREEERVFMTKKDKPLYDPAFG